MRSRITLLKRAAASLTAAGVALAGTIAVSAVPAQAAVKRFETPFAYQGSAYGTRVSLGDPNQGGITSGRTAWSIIGCTAMAPIRNVKNVASVGTADSIRIGAVESITNSYRRPKRQIFGSRSVSTVSDVTIGPADGPRITIGAIKTRAHAFNKKGRFDSTADFDLFGLKLAGIVPEEAGPAEDLLNAIDAGDNQLTEAIIEGAGTNGIAIPGLGTIYPAGSHRTPKSRNGATANAYGIRVILENGSQVNIGYAFARILTAYPAGVFDGHAYALEAVVGEGVAGLGRSPYRNLPCIGTNGEWRENNLAGVDLGGQIVADAMTAETYGKPFRDGRALARARSSVASVVLGGGQLEIQAVVGQVNVFQNKEGRVVRRTIDGTRVGAILVDGEPQELPPPGDPLEIPGLAKIEFAKKQVLGKFKRGIRVHALRVTMLDGTGLVLDIGTAKAKIMR